MKESPKLIHVDKTLEPLDNEILSAITSLNQSVILDVSAVEKTSISALNLILEALQILNKHNETLALIRPSACVRTWLYITKLQDFIPIFPNLTMANAYINEFCSAKKSLID